MSNRGDQTAASRLSKQARSAFGAKQKVKRAEFFFSLRRRDDGGDTTGECVVFFVFSGVEDTGVSGGTGVCIFYPVFILSGASSEGEG